MRLKQPDAALTQFELSLQQSPGRRNALLGASKAAELSKNQERSQFYEAELKRLPER